MSRQEWYAEGLRFECTMCGNCCTGAPGYVAVSEPEAREIARSLGMTLQRFYAAYTHETSQGRSLNERETPFGMDCVFLDRTTIPGKAVCSLYERRPLQCRTFPWWPENLRDRRSWERVGRRCEGVGRGAVVPVEAIRIERDRQAAHTPGGGPRA